VTVVPIGFDEEGIPVAVQVIARQGNDHLTLAAAQVLEGAFGGWRCAMR
jgi:fatty acid amide hydrolase 2